MSNTRVEFSTPSAQLAVIIPAFKRRFLAEALDSLAQQTDPRFHVYVCDDGSPEPLRDVVEAALSPERLTYRRFEQNMGARRVVSHWNRSVRSTTEPWVWLFSDDDMMEPRCVETFLAAVATDPDGSDVWRFNTLQMDTAGTVTRINPPHPPNETAVEFTYHRLLRDRVSFAPEYVFRRAAFDRCGGFVEMDFGLGSDDASWITFTGQRSIRTLAGPRVRWRLSDVNISGPSQTRSIEKQKAYLEYAAWLAQRFAGQSPLSEDVPIAFSMEELARQWFLVHLHNYGGKFTWRDVREMSALAEARLGWPRSRVTLLMLGVNARRLPRALKRALLGR